MGWQPQLWLPALPYRVYGTHVNSKELIKELIKDGWFEDRVNGSHHVFKHPVKPGHLSVPHPKKDLGPGLVAKLKKAAGL